MDDKTKMGTPGGSLINVSENYELEYWSNKLGVRPEQLKSAVRAVGNSVVAVERQLKKLKLVKDQSCFFFEKQ